MSSKTFCTTKEVYTVHKVRTVIGVDIFGADGALMGFLRLKHKVPLMFVGAKVQVGVEAGVIYVEQINPRPLGQILGKEKVPTMIACSAVVVVVVVHVVESRGRCVCKVVRNNDFTLLFYSSL